MRLIYSSKKEKLKFFLKYYFDKEIDMFDKHE